MCIRDSNYIVPIYTVWRRRHARCSSVTRQYILCVICEVRRNWFKVRRSSKKFKTVIKFKKFIELKKFSSQMAAVCSPFNHIYNYACNYWHFCIFDFSNLMNFIFYNKVHKVQANNEVQKIRTSQLCCVWTTCLKLLFKSGMAASQTYMWPSNRESNIL